MSEPTRTPTLWCLHILGPDDVIPAPSQAHAERAAQKVNEWAKKRLDDHAPRIEAVAAPWPHDAKSHADEVDTFIEQWLLPSGQVKALAQQPAAVDDIEAMREDAARYRWLRENCGYSGSGPHNGVQVIVYYADAGGGRHGIAYTGPCTRVGVIGIDCAIDKARAALRKQGAGHE